MTTLCPHCRGEQTVIVRDIGCRIECTYCHASGQVSLGDAEVYVRVLEQRLASGDVTADEAVRIFGPRRSSA